VVALPTEAAAVVVVVAAVVVAVVVVVVAVVVVRPHPLLQPRVMLPTWNHHTRITDPPICRHHPPSPRMARR